MEQATIYLTGYFDRNFGDDVMMQLVVRKFPEIRFLVENTVDTPLLSEPNVVQKNRAECSAFPKLVVTGSGFMINTKAAFKTELMRYFRGSHPGDYCLGCNIEPLDDPMKKFLITRKLNRFKLITCRDQNSYDWLVQNTRRPELYYAPDILFSIPEKWIRRADDPEMLGISLMHRAGDCEDCDYYRAMAEAADNWIHTTGKGVILMAFDTGKEDDLAACRAVQKHMQFPQRAEIAAHKNGTEILTAFSRCERIIGARFHSLVLALRMGIPFYPVIYREKMRNVIRDLNYPIHGCEIDRIDRKAISGFLCQGSFSFSLQRDILSAACEHTLRLEQMISRN